MTYDQAVQVVKQAMRKGVYVSVAPAALEAREFLVWVGEGSVSEFDSYSAALDAVDVEAAQP